MKTKNIVGVDEISNTFSSHQYFAIEFEQSNKPLTLGPWSVETIIELINNLLRNVIFKREQVKKNNGLMQQCNVRALQELGDFSSNFHEIVHITKKNCFEMAKPLMNEKVKKIFC